MRSFLIALAIFAFVVQSEASAQQKLSQKEIKDKLKKLGISLEPGGFRDGRDGQRAYIRPVDQDTLRGLDLLRDVMNLDEIILAKADAKWTTACLERLNDFPKLKVLRVEASALGENDVKSIAKLKALEHLKLECPKFSESQIKLIGDMKSLQSFHLAALDFPPKSAKLLRVALPKVNEFYLEHIPAILSAPLVEIAKNDTPLAKLQKARLNAALNGMKSICQDSRIGSAHLGGPASLEMMRHLREAILELDDPGLAEPIVRDYVQLAEIAFNAKDARFRQFGESTKENHLLECVYLDAQIIQLKLKKKLDDKKP